MALARLRLPLVGLLALTIAAAAPLARPAVLAQDAASYDVAIYQGSCEEPADAPAFELGSTYPYGADPEEEEDDDEVRGVADVPAIATIDEPIESDFEALLDDLPHLIAVLGAGGTVDDMVACGELGGIVEDGRLVVGIRPVGDSGIAGVAILDEDEEGILGIGEDEVSVRVYLTGDLAGGVAGAPPAADAGAETTLRNQADEEVGTATFAQTDGEVTITVALDAGALEPGEHGIHIHEAGACDPSGETPFESAGGHFNPTGASHGGPDDPAEEAHAGDLGNLTAAEDGSATFEITTDRVTLAEGEATSLNDADGSALVVHADPDDLETDPSGNSGERLICGVIFPAA